MALNVWQKLLEKYVNDPKLIKEILKIIPRKFRKKIAPEMFDTYAKERSWVISMVRKAGGKNDIKSWERVFEIKKFIRDSTIPLDKKKQLLQQMTRWREEPTKIIPRLKKELAVIGKIGEKILSKKKGIRVWCQIKGNRRYSKLDDKKIVEFLESKGQLTKEGIEKFARQVEALYSDKGVSKLNELLKLGRRGASGKDSGFSGKVFEEMLVKYADSKKIKDLNSIKHNFNVVDLVSEGVPKKKALIYSVARGTPDYLLKKAKKLFNLMESENFEKMLKLLSKNGYLPTVHGPFNANTYQKLQDEFIKRARLLVPETYVNPLKVIITSQRDIDDKLKRRMINAITSIPK